MRPHVHSQKQRGSEQINGVQRKCAKNPKRQDRCIAEDLRIRCRDHPKGGGQVEYHHRQNQPARLSRCFGDIFQGLEHGYIRWQRGAKKIRAGELFLLKARGFVQDRALKIGFLQSRPQQVGALQIGLHQAGSLEIRQKQISALQRRLAEPRVLQVGIGEVGSVQVRAGKIRTLPLLAI